MALPRHNDLVAVAFQSATLILLTLAYIRIYKVARYHQNHIQDQCQFQNIQVIENFRVKKSTLNAFYVYIIALAYYLPNVLASILLAVDNTRMPTLVACYASGLFLFLNSSLNPLVYCWRYREIRHIVKTTASTIFSNNQMP